MLRHRDANIDLEQIAVPALHRRRDDRHVTAGDRSLDEPDLEASGKREAPKIEQTLELLRSRFNDIKKPKAT
jgi:hypothetical protein